MKTYEAALYKPFIVMALGYRFETRYGAIADSFPSTIAPQAKMG